MTSWLIRLGLSDRLSSPVMAKVECCKPLDHSDKNQGLLSYQDSVLKNLQVTTHDQQVAPLVGGGVLPLCIGAIGIFYCPSQQGGEPN